MENYKRKSLRVDSSFPSDNASPEDRETLKLFTWQEKSIIIDLKGNTKEFTASTQDWINEILGVTGYDKREKGNEYSWPKAD